MFSFVVFNFFVHNYSSLFNIYVNHINHEIRLFGFSGIIKKKKNKKEEEKMRIQNNRSKRIKLNQTELKSTSFFL